MCCNNYYKGEDCEMVHDETAANWLSRLSLPPHDGHFQNQAQNASVKYINTNKDLWPHKLILKGWS